MLNQTSPQHCELSDGGSESRTAVVMRTGKMPASEAGSEKATACFSAKNKNTYPLHLSHPLTLPVSPLCFALLSIGGVQL